MYQIENEQLKVTISKNAGAQITSIIYQNEERIHQSDAFWSGQDPFLFPWIGNVDAHVKHEDFNKLKKHGLFAKENLIEPQLIDHTQTKVVLKFNANFASYQKYPYKFSIIKTIGLDKTSLSVSYLIINEETQKSLPYNIGAHPAFKINDFSKLQIKFNKALNSYSEKLDLNTGYVNSREKYLLDYQCKNNQYQFSRKNFRENDTIILDNQAINMVSLIDHDEIITLSFGKNFKTLSLWTNLIDNKTNFICIEPWSNINYNQTSDYFNDHMEHLAPNQSKNYHYKILFEKKIRNKS